MLGAGTMFTVAEDSEAARAIIAFLRAPIAHEIWMARSGFLAPYTEASAEVVPSDPERALDDILLSATTFRFDGSDLMPGEIGTLAFWSAVVGCTVGAPAEAAAGAVRSRWETLQQAARDGERTGGGSGRPRPISSVGRGP